MNYITSKNTILRYEDRRYLKLFTEYLKEQKISDFSIDFSLWKIHEPRSRLIRPFSECEITQLLRYIREEASSGKRNEVMILTAISTGLRGIDLVKLRLTDIDWKQKFEFDSEQDKKACFNSAESYITEFPFKIHS